MTALVGRYSTVPSTLPNRETPYITPYDLTISLAAAPKQLLQSLSLHHQRAPRNHRASLPSPQTTPTHSSAQSDVKVKVTGPKPGTYIWLQGARALTSCNSPSLLLPLTAFCSSRFSTPSPVLHRPALARKPSLPALSLGRSHPPSLAHPPAVRSVMCAHLDTFTHSSDLACSIRSTQRWLNSARPKDSPLAPLLQLLAKVSTFLLRRN